MNLSLIKYGNNIQKQDTDNCLPVSEEFVEKYKKQAGDRNNYLTKTASRNLYNILAPEVGIFIFKLRRLHAITYGLLC